MKNKFLIMISLLAVISSTSIVNAIQAPLYNSFDDLSASEVEGVDYRVLSEDKGKDITVFSVHGGGLSVGISEIVNALQTTNNYNYYLFEGLKGTDNNTLRITSTKYDEDDALSLITNSKNTVSLIAANETEKVVYVGGQNKLLSRLIKLHLSVSGFNVKDDTEVPSRIAGIMNSNIVNMNMPLVSGYKIGGSQISVSRGLRDEFVTDEVKFNNFINAVDSAMSDSWSMASQILDNLGLE